MYYKVKTVMKMNIQNCKITWVTTSSVWYSIKHAPAPHSRNWLMDMNLDKNLCSAHSKH